MQCFIEKECISWLCSIEIGKTLQRLHFQAVFRIMSTTTIVVIKVVKLYLEWDKDEAPPISHVFIQKLNGIRLHIYVDVLGYCVKDRREDHFEVLHNNISDDELAP